MTDAANTPRTDALLAALDMLHHYAFKGRHTASEAVAIDGARQAIRTALREAEAAAPTPAAPLLVQDLVRIGSDPGVPMAYRRTAKEWVNRLYAAAPTPAEPLVAPLEPLDISDEEADAFMQAIESFDKPESLDVVLAELREEIGKARAKHAPINSPHEGWAVIREELDPELWEHVCGDTGRSPEARHEALQVAAMGVRYILDLIDDPPAARSEAER